MRYWILFYRPEGGVDGFGSGEGHRLEISDTSFGPPLQDTGTIDVRFCPDQNDQFFQTASVSCQLGYELLWRERLLRQSMTIRFNVAGIHGNIRGGSSALIFALATICEGARRQFAFPAIAATGGLGEFGEVRKVSGVVAKLQAAIFNLPHGGICFYPADNIAEVDKALMDSAQKKRVQLLPVARLDQAVTHLGIPLTHTWLESPYRGLEVFEYDHRSIYFGRQKEIVTVCALLEERVAAGRPGVLILGSSGTGKSSLVQAGVLPTLIDSNPQDMDWQVWRPQMAELRNEEGLYQSILRNWEALPACSALKAEQQMGKLDDIPALWVRNQVDGRPFVWVVDQLEEMFTLGFAPEVVESFARLLKHLQGMGMWLIATLRSDFFDTYSKQESLWRVFDHQAQYTLHPLKLEALRQVIEGPAKAKDVEFETDESGVSLVDYLLRDVGSAENGLPLLEFTLSELYRERRDEDKKMTFAAYQKIGGIHGAIGQAAQRALGEYDASLHEQLPILLRALVRVDKVEGARYTAKVLNLGKVNFSDSTKKLIDKLVAQRLLILGGASGSQQPHLRVAHEALLSNWDLAKAILAESRDYMMVRDRLSRYAEIWTQTGCHASRLLAPGLPLDEARELFDKFAEELKEEPELVKYISASIQADEERVARSQAEAKASNAAKRRGERFFMVAGVVGTCLCLYVLNLSWDIWEYKRRAINNKLAEERAILVKLKADTMPLIARAHAHNADLFANTQDTAELIKKLNAENASPNEKKALQQRLQANLEKQKRLELQLKADLDAINALAAQK